MQEKQAIITLNYGYETNMWYKYMREVFIPSIKDYAKRINVDFILMNNNNSKYYNTWNQLQFMDYLDYYDRVMYIDGDCYISKFNKLNFFKIVSFDEIGLYKDIFAKNPICNNVFIVMVIDKSNRIYFTPLPSVYDQKHKWEISSEYICSFGRRMIDACYGDEECYINECIYLHKLKNKITHLINLKSIEYSPFLTKNMMSNKTDLIFHIKLQSTKIILSNDKFYKVIMNKINKKEELTK